MKKLFFLFIVLLAAIGLGFLIHKDPGYAMVSYNHWVIATSMWVAAATLLLAFIIFYFIVRLIKTIFSIPKRLARRRQFIHAQKYRKYMTLGIAELNNSNVKKAQKYFVRLKKLGLVSEFEYQHLTNLTIIASPAPSSTREKPL
jgi:HemY protein